MLFMFGIFSNRRKKMRLKNLVSDYWIWHIASETYLWKFSESHLLSPPINVNGVDGHMTIQKSWNLRREINRWLGIPGTVAILSQNHSTFLNNHHDLN